MNTKNILGMVSAIALVLFASVVSAQTTSTSPSSTDESQPNNNKGLVTGLISTTGLGSASTISSAVGGFVQGGGAQAGLDVKRYALSGNTGAAAAAGATQWNVWGAFSRNNIAYNFAPLQSSGSVNVYLAGIDYTFANNVVFGVATAVDRTDVDLNFSGGKLTGNGVTVAPYLGIAINKNLAFDGTIGVGRTNVDTVVGTVTGSTRSDRNVGSLGLTYREVVGAWSFTGRGALLSVHDKLGAYTLSNGTFVPDGSVNVTQIRILGQAAYTSGPVTPYVSLTYINDISRPDQTPVGGVAAANDRDAWTPAIGVRFRADNAVYGSIQYSTERARSEVKNNQFLLNLGVRF
jgi:Autotransporter beta-domain